jgi:hypothetical protein
MTSQVSTETLLSIQHMMVDLETMGTHVGAPILSIGAVMFDPNSDDMGERFHVGIELESNVECGRHPDPSTIMWWMAEDRAEARKALLDLPKVDLYSALDELAKWAPEGEVWVWGNGAAFDNVILASAYKTVGIEPFWKYKHDRCFRTINHLAPDVEWEDYGTAHDALDDAVSQARHLQKVVKHLGIVV